MTRDFYTTEELSRVINFDDFERANIPGCIRYTNDDGSIHINKIDDDLYEVMSS